MRRAAAQFREAANHAAMKLAAGVRLVRDVLDFIVSAELFDEPRRVVFVGSSVCAEKPCAPGKSRIRSFDPFPTQRTSRTSRSTLDFCSPTSSLTRSPAP